MLILVKLLTIYLKFSFHNLSHIYTTWLCTVFVSLVTDLATILIIIYVHDKTIRYGVYHICEKQQAMGGD